jgi:hypothetical protein
MTKSPSDPVLDTLVEDIYEVLRQPLVCTEDQAKSFATGLSKRLHLRLAEAREGQRLRMSNFGRRCDRQLWLQISEPEAVEALPPDARLKFLTGDIIEETLLFLARVAGHKVEGEQDEISFFGIKGHRDAVIDGVTVDVKSASPYSFGKFVSGAVFDDDPFGYLPQLRGYVLGSDQDPLVTDHARGAFLVQDKVTGKLALMSVPVSPADREAAVAAAQHSQLMVEGPEPTRTFSDQPIGKGGNYGLGVECRYCDVKHRCWPGLRTFKYASGPVFLTRVQKEPDVPEI